MNNKIYVKKKCIQKTANLFTEQNGNWQSMRVNNINIENGGTVSLFELQLVSRFANIKFFSRF